MWTQIAKIVSHFIDYLAGEFTEQLKKKLAKSVENSQGYNELKMRVQKTINP